MSESKYPKVGGKWIRPVRRGFQLKCCGCGLIHEFDFRIVKRGKRNDLHMRFWRA